MQYTALHKLQEIAAAVAVVGVFRNAGAHDWIRTDNSDHSRASNVTIRPYIWSQVETSLPYLYAILDKRGQRRILHYLWQRKVCFI